MEQAITALSLVGNNQALVQAVWNGEVLQLIHAIKIKKRFNFKKKIIPILQDLKQKENLILVEEKTEFISPYADQNVLLDEKDHLGNSNLYTALDLYWQLQALDSLRFVARELLEYRIQEEWIDIQQDMSGTTKYHIDWNALQAKAGCRSLLLILWKIAPQNQIFNDAYLNEFFFEREKTIKEEILPHQRMQKCLEEKTFQVEMFKLEEQAKIFLQQEPSIHQGLYTHYCCFCGKPIRQGELFLNLEKTFSHFQCAKNYAIQQLS